MDVQRIKQLTKTYFNTNHCRINDITNDVFEVHLTEEMDKKIMNRPFYWHYVEATQAKGEPKTLLLGTHTHYDNQEIEPLYYGSTRFQQILKDLTKDVSFIQAFESVDTDKKQPLYPWLLVNIKISYASIQIKDEIFSLGLNLITGKIVVHMMEHLQQVPMHATISDFCYLLTPMITYESGFKRLEHILDVYIEEQSHDWAVQSMKAMENELELLDTFYATETKEKQREKHAIKERYKPTITFNVLSGGVIYVTNAFQPKKEK